MTDQFDVEIRRALEAKALEVDVPGDLATRTIEAAGEASSRSLGQRFRAWRDARNVGSRVVGYPRLVYAGAAAAMAVILFAIGGVVVREPGGDNTVQEAAESLASSGMDESGAGQTAVGAPSDVAEPQTGGEVAGGAGGSAAGPVLRDRSALSAGEGAADVDKSASQVAPDIAPIEPPIPGGSPGKFPPKIIRTADIEVEVRSFSRAWDRATQLATKHGGFITSSNTEQLNGRLGRGTLQIRVPADKLDAALADIRKLGTLQRMSSSGNDVSGQIVDIDARRRAMEAEELQLLEVMKEAEGVSQVLEVRDRLNTVRQEIESLKGQKEMLEGQVAYSTINATLFESGAEPEEEPPGDGIIPLAFEKGVGAGLRVIGGAIVVLGVLIPLTLMVLLAWWVVRLVRRRG